MVTTNVAIKSVLVVDDEPDICEAVELALKMEGYTVTAAHDRNEALKAIESGAPAVILLDYRMPGLNVEDFMLKLRERKIESPIVLMTAGRNPRDTANELGLTDFLSKPFDLSTLLDLVKKYSKG
jgi:DNA-binding NtrC family response regulator